MASYTGNLGLKKPALDDDALITDINNNMDILDAAVNGIQDGLAIVANGNTHVAITAGQFVYVRNHGTLTEGLYVASTNIAANATLSTSNLTADSAGGLNTLNSKIAIYDLGSFSSISDMETAISALKTNYDNIDIHFKLTEATLPFTTTDYYGRFYKVGATRCYVNVYQASSMKEIVGYENSGTWTWKTVTIA